MDEQRGWEILSCGDSVCLDELGALWQLKTGRDFLLGEPPSPWSTKSQFLEKGQECESLIIYIILLRRY